MEVFGSGAPLNSQPMKVGELLNYILAIPKTFSMAAIGSCLVVVSVSLLVLLVWFVRCAAAQLITKVHCFGLGEQLQFPV